MRVKIGYQYEMPKNYIKKTNRCEINENNMKLAIKVVLTGTLSQYKAAQEYQLKRQTLQSRIKILLKKNSKEELLTGWADSGNESEEEVSYTSKYIAREVFISSQELALTISR
ncbi:helix-turn-helix psq domain [Holotrichia oblita]|uniref:Helix-turn-helix psq domain n=1 Tax=Holotrichia oblita TaxID=644536 RepID=A0ACB9SJI7_HOLOL|nr:helix-turn-helix psq domain [Holotrichia oblita]